jgi:hypothetical protein
MKKLSRKIGLAAAGIGMAAGLALATTIPAEAVTMSRVNHCAWPGKATFDLVGDSASYGYSWTAYSPTGWKLGTHWGLSWATPWEDVSVWVYSNDPSFDIVSWCR